MTNSESDRTDPEGRKKAALIAPRVAAYGLAMFFALGLVRIATDVGWLPRSWSASLAFLGIAAFPIIVAWLWAHPTGNDSPDAGELRRPLPTSVGLIVAGAAFVLAGAIIALRTPAESGSDPAADVHLAGPLVVLPFIDLDGRSDSYFGTGFRSELVETLGGVPGLRVVARSSATAYADVNRDAAEAARTLGGGTVLDVSVRRASGRLRVDARLLDAASGRVGWQAHVDTTADAVSVTRDSLVLGVVRRLGLQADGDLTRRLERRRTTPDVFDLYFQGVYRAARAGSRLPRGSNPFDAAGFFQLAVEGDPGFAPAWSSLAREYAMLPRSSAMAAERARTDGAAAARSALQIEPEDASAHAALAGILLAYEYDADAARAHLDRAGELDPGSAVPHELRCELELSRGDVPRAAEHCAVARRLDPLRFRIGWLEADLARVGGDAGGSVARLDSLARAYPEFEPVAADLAIARLVAGDTTEAAAVDLTLWLAMLGAPDSIGYRLLGRLETGTGGGAPGALLSDIDGLERDLASAAALYALLGDADGGLELALRALREGDPGALRFAAWPEYARLRSNPTFAERLDESGLAIQLAD